MKPFAEDMISQRYLDWLSDPDVNFYSRRLGQRKQSREDAIEWLARIADGTTVLAIFAPEFGHIGNIKFGPIDSVNQSSDIAIMIGERKSWNRGYGAEAISLVTRHLFDTGSVSRVEAGSANPAFIKLVHGLGWKIDRIEPKRVLIGDQLLDWTYLSLEKIDAPSAEKTDCIPYD
ncbi:GNAT family N-acetyltransferase [Tardiphaga alba]|uniref:GNAT family N-acetyltransferase n=1 Tax=Tardiphaga alba TaxID=340268 RepID=UPI001BA8D33C|nr:GNAT family N-acetyltransferase [Tardiphaga alba]